jgi:hypothetical protein
MAAGWTDHMSTERLTWDEMQHALAQAKRSGIDVMSAICHAPDRRAAGQAVSELLGCRAEVGEQLLDAPLNEFIASADGPRAGASEVGA